MGEQLCYLLKLLEKGGDSYQRSQQQSSHRQINTLNSQMRRKRKILQ
ncbi:unnamed protein product [Paramecium octaurelia]|uniref:Uncharacterized protein n=1 Tax=Paramecium octaurelia TaxID=43137 RepID=A0A8S1WSJ1_PAROT|nr:unnamed protein product [Paramecium octaurelia]